MKSSKGGESISASVENITPFGIWLFANGTEYFLSFQEFPYFREQVLGAIQDVQLLHGRHLYWPQLDVDLELDNLVNPGKYPLKSRMGIKSNVKNYGSKLKTKAQN